MPSSSDHNSWHLMPTSESIDFADQDAASPSVNDQSALDTHDADDEARVDGSTPGNPSETMPTQASIPDQAQQPPLPSIHSWLDGIPSTAPPPFMAQQDVLPGHSRPELVDYSATYKPPPGFVSGYEGVPANPHPPFHPQFHRSRNFEQHAGPTTQNAWGYYCPVGHPSLALPPPPSPLEELIGQYPAPSTLNAWGDAVPIGHPSLHPAHNPYLIPGIPLSDQPSWATAAFPHHVLNQSIPPGHLRARSANWSQDEQISSDHRLARMEALQHDRDLYNRDLHDLNNFAHRRMLEWAAACGCEACQAITRRDGGQGGV